MAGIVSLNQHSHRISPDVNINALNDLLLGVYIKGKIYIYYKGQLKLALIRSTISKSVDVCYTGCLIIFSQIENEI